METIHWYRLYRGKKKPKYFRALNYGNAIERAREITGSDTVIIQRASPLVRGFKHYALAMVGAVND